MQVLWKSVEYSELANVGRMSWILAMHQTIYSLTQVLFSPACFSNQIHQTVTKLYVTEFSTQFHQLFRKAGNLWVIELRSIVEWLLLAEMNLRNYLSSLWQVAISKDHDKVRTVYQHGKTDDIFSLKPQIDEVLWSTGDHSKSPSWCQLTYFLEYDDVTEISGVRKDGNFGAQLKAQIKCLLIHEFVRNHQETQVSNANNMNLLF
jgi:hypothetical protein